jgi:hypothetical protein
MFVSVKVDDVLKMREAALPLMMVLADAAPLMIKLLLIEISP